MIENGHKTTICKKRMQPPWAHHGTPHIFFEKKVGKNGGKWRKMFNFVANFK
jgi:tellurite resistance-related uncharacterized protein